MSASGGHGGRAPHSARRYWNANLDTDNLSRRADGTAPEQIDEALAYARTPEFEWLVGRAGDVRDRWVVDLGGGVGMHALLWAQAGARVVVVDPAVERLRALRRLARRAGLAHRLVLIGGAGEHLPLIDDAVDVVFTKSVLIHTRLGATAQEIHRALKPGGHGLFIEPLKGNPLIRLYRATLAPRIWRDITRYFDRAALQELRRPFGRLRWKPFYLLSVWSFVWQYGLKRPERFERSLRRWMHADARLRRLWPWLERWAWFAAIEVRKPEPTDRG